MPALNLPDKQGKYNNSTSLPPNACYTYTVLVLETVETSRNGCSLSSTRRLQVIRKEARLSVWRSESSPHVDWMDSDLKVVGLWRKSYTKYS